MIRVFLLALLGLAALAMVARNLPDSLRPSPDRAIEWEADLTPLDRWDGAWTGTFVTYEADGTRDATVRRTLRYTRADDRHQTVAISDEDAGGRTREIRQEQTFDGSALTSRRTMEDGSVVILEGRRSGGTVTWHRRDAATGALESFRERIVPTPEGDMLTVEGVLLPGTGGAPRLIEGRYHRLDQDRD